MFLHLPQAATLESDGKPLGTQLRLRGGGLGLIVKLYLRALSGIFDFMRNNSEN
jgi:hypothetical protein